MKTLQLRDAKASLSAVVNAAEAIGRHPDFADIAVAAIAKSHNLVVLTMNRRYFDPLRVEVLNPFEAA